MRVLVAFFCLIRLCLSTARRLESTSAEDEQARIAAKARLEDSGRLLSMVHRLNAVLDDSKRVSWQLCILGGVAAKIKLTVAPASPPGGSRDTTTVGRIDSAADRTAALRPEPSGAGTAADSFQFLFGAAGPATDSYWGMSAEERRRYKFAPPWEKEGDYGRRNPKKSFVLRHTVDRVSGRLGATLRLLASHHPSVLALRADKKVIERCKPLTGEGAAKVSLSPWVKLFYTKRKMLGKKDSSKPRASNSREPLQLLVSPTPAVLLRGDTLSEEQRKFFHRLLSHAKTLYVRLLYGADFSGEFLDAAATTREAQVATSAAEGPPKTSTETQQDAALDTSTKERLRQLLGQKFEAVDAFRGYAYSMSQPGHRMNGVVPIAPKLGVLAPLFPALPGSGLVSKSGGELEAEPQVLDVVNCHVVARLFARLANTNEEGDRSSEDTADEVCKKLGIVEAPVEAQEGPGTNRDEAGGVEHDEASRCDENAPNVELCVDK
eukprot:g6064.t1